MSIFSKLFGSKKIDEEQAGSNETLSQDLEVFDDPATQVVDFKNITKPDNSPKIDDNPDTLPEAIRYVVDKWGKDYLQDRGFINVLNDFKVLKDIPAAKHIITNMQSNGYIEKITLAQNWEVESKSISIKYADEFGAREDIVNYIVKCLGYGLQFSDEKPVYVEPVIIVEAPTNNASSLNTRQPQLPQQQPLGPYDPKLDLENYRYPMLDLLNKYDRPNIDMAEQTENKNRIIELLRSYGIEISSIKGTVGPVTTLYEMTLAPGVLISKVRRIENDFCLSFASGCRIIAPIPGKGTIGVLLPNALPSIVSMESILNTKKYQESHLNLPCAIGKTITNEVYMFDLVEAPHLLVAGATGQGKSIFLNTIITSLLYKKHPAELKIVLIDPKKIEFSIYAPICNHFLAQTSSSDNDPIIASDSSAVQTLDSLCKLMDTRFDLLKEVGARNIRDYNGKFITRCIAPRNGHGYMPYIVVIIDEYGDLMMTAGKDMELPIIRLSQMAHVVGIHLIIATRRLSSKIITENLKLNFLTRIAFRVASESDSRIILDRSGAQQLMGRGDMLYQHCGGEPIQIQCAFVDTPEIERICAFISNQHSYNMPFELPDSYEPDYAEPPIDVDMAHLDPLFEDAARLVVLNQSGSTSLIQRKFVIGYNRAGRLMDQLEKAGVVGAAMGSKPREVMIQDERSLNNLLNSLR